MNITVIDPVVGDVSEETIDLKREFGFEIEISNVTLSSGPTAIECERDSLEAGLHLVDRACEAERVGASAIVINCMADPAVYAVREAVDIPVTSAGEAAIHWAHMLGARIGWIDVAPDARLEVQRQFDRNSLGNRYYEFGTISVSPDDIQNRREEVVDRFARVALEMVEKSNVETLIMGCTGLASLQQEFQRRINERMSGRDYYVQLVSGLPLAIATAATLAGAGLRHR